MMLGSTGSIEVNLTLIPKFNLQKSEEREYDDEWAFSKYIEGPTKR